MRSSGHLLTTSSRLSFAVSACAAVVLAAGARADVVAARGKPALVSTQVLRLQQGRLVCRADGGGEVSFPVEQVDYMQITGWDMLDLAEKQRRAGDWRRAAVSYEKALADLQLEQAGDAQGGPPARGADVLDRKLLIQCRLIPAWDAQGRFERAVELYLEAIEVMPALTDVLRPTSFPETGSAVLEMAGRQVDAAIRRHGDDAVARSLQNWRTAWPQRPVTTVPESLPDDGQTVVSPIPQWTEAIKAIAGLVGSGRHAEALEQVNAWRPRVHGRLLADVYYWQGRAFEASVPNAAAGGPGGTATQPARSAATARAGLAYMRLPIHFPQHPLAAECLYRAGELCRRGGEAEQAGRLWAELINAYPQAKSPDGKIWADKAREELKR